MGQGYSLHISSKSHSIKDSKSLSSVFNHNYRKYQNQKQYDRNNVIELLPNNCNTAKEFREKFNQCFSNEVAEYNAKQKRDDRKIIDYFQTCENEKNKDVAVEIILQVADKDYWENNADKRKIMKEVFKEQIETLKVAVPGFYLTNATLHLDEKSPHLHIVGIPISNGFSKGMKRQCSKRKIFTKERLTNLQDTMRKNAEELMQKYVDKDFKIDEKTEGRNYDYSLKEITRIKKDKTLINRAVEEIKKEIRAEVLESKEERDKIIEEIKSNPELIKKVENHLQQNEQMQNKVIEQLKTKTEIIEKAVSEVAEKLDIEEVKAYAVEKYVEENSYELEKNLVDNSLKNERIVRTILNETAENLYDFEDKLETDSYTFTEKLYNENTEDLLKIHNLLKTMQEIGYLKLNSALRELKRQLSDLIEDLKSKFNSIKQVKSRYETKTKTALKR
jgi:predicted XRE-type DNA-binding protein